MRIIFLLAFWAAIRPLFAQTIVLNSPTDHQTDVWIPANLSWGYSGFSFGSYVAYKVRILLWEKPATGMTLGEPHWSDETSNIFTTSVVVPGYELEVCKDYIWQVVLLGGTSTSGGEGHPATVSWTPLASSDLWNFTTTCDESESEVVMSHPYIEIPKKATPYVYLASHDKIYLKYESPYVGDLTCKLYSWDMENTYSITFLNITKGLNYLVWDISGLEDLEYTGSTEEPEDIYLLEVTDEKGMTRSLKLKIDANEE